MPAADTEAPGSGQSTGNGVSAESFEDLTFDEYRLGEMERTGVSHNLEKIDTVIEYGGRRYDLTVTEHPEGGARLRASRRDGAEVYRGRTNFFPPTNSGVEEILEGETLERTY